MKQMTCHCGNTFMSTNGKLSCSDECSQISKARITRTPMHDRIDAEYEVLLDKVSHDEEAWACVRRAFQIGILYGGLG